MIPGSLSPVTQSCTGSSCAGAVCALGIHYKLLEQLSRSDMLLRFTTHPSCSPRNTAASPLSRGPCASLLYDYIEPSLQANLQYSLAIPLNQTSAILQYQTRIMTTHIESNAIESNAMDIDSDPSSHSIQSNASHIIISYVDDYENLPSSGPTSHAHIVDLSEYADIVKEDGMVKLQDAVVTTLYNTSPDILKSFLSPTVNTIKAVYAKKDVQLVIWRKGLEVFVSKKCL
jgi:hypothetical protein